MALARGCRMLGLCGMIVLTAACSVMPPSTSVAVIPTTATAADVGIEDGVGVAESPDATHLQEITSPVVGQLYEPAEHHGALPAVLMLHGSEGFDRDSSPGQLHDLAKHLAAQGFATLALCYFGCVGRPPDLRRISLEYVLDAVQFLRSLPEVDAANVSVWGWSRGGELALLVGSHSPDVRSVIALYGAPWAVGGFGSPAALADCAWTLDGACLPSMDRIAVERIQGPVLLMVGQYDAVWPMAYSEQISAELDAAHHPHLLTVFPRVGHAFGAVRCMIGVSACRPLGGMSLRGWDAEAYVTASRVTFAQTVTLLKSLATSNPVQLPNESPVSNTLVRAVGETTPTPAAGSGAVVVEESQKVVSLLATSDFATNVANQVQTPLQGMYADVSVSANVQLVDPSMDQFVDLGCRSAGESSQYRLIVYPASGTFQIGRAIDGRAATLSGVQSSSLIHTGSAANIVELSCQGARIGATINGERAAIVTDYTLTRGQVWIGAGQSAAHLGAAARTPAGATIEANFTNVVVRQL